MRMYDIIDAKRTGKNLTEEQIVFFIKGYTYSKIPDYQASALLMAICLVGMNNEETFYLTKAMIDSGTTLDLSSIKGITVDKHSTGGVGDKTTLIVLSIVAALGIKSAKMSGRGLGHTGGTIDKVESIPGFKVNLSKKEFLNIVDTVGFGLIYQLESLAAADKKLYALRDVTATVNSLPLIASSIMSKKIASGADCIVLDVKFGNGAFMKTKEDAEHLAKIMVQIAKKFNKRAVALITNMNKPLGKAIGNSLEIIEVIDILNGKGPKDLKELSLELAAHMLNISGFSHDKKKCKEASKKAILSKKALEKFKQVAKAQGADISYIENTEKFKKSKFNKDVLFSKNGTIKSVQTQNIGDAAVVLGAGRKTKEDLIDHGAGIILEKNVGDKILKGERIARIFSNQKESLKFAEEIILNSIEVTNKKVFEEKLMQGIII